MVFVFLFCLAFPIQGCQSLRMTWWETACKTDHLHNLKQNCGKITLMSTKFTRKNQL